MCTCVEAANAQLREHNTKIDQTLMINPKSGDMKMMVMVPTVKANRKDRKPALKVAASFCPMCGVPIDNGPTRNGRGEQ